MPPPLPNDFGTLHTRIGVIGDIHTSITELRWALEVLEAQGVEQIYATGDIVDGPGSGSCVMSACELLRKHRVVCVLGNHDRWLLDAQQRDLPDATSPHELTLETRAYLQCLPASVEVRTPRGLMLLGHGLGSHDMGALYPHDHGPALRNNLILQQLVHSARHRFVVSGHTHRRMVRRLEGMTFVNAGALHYTRSPCCVVLDFRELRAQFHDYRAQLGPSFDL